MDNIFIYIACALVSVVIGLFIGRRHRKKEVVEEKEIHVKKIESQYRESLDKINAIEEEHRTCLSKIGKLEKEKKELKEEIDLISAASSGELGDKNLADFVALNKKIKKLKNEIDECEEEKEELEDELKKLKKNSVELNVFTEKELELDKALKDLSLKTEQCDDANKSLQVKNKTINFVKEVLGAKISIDNSYQSSYESIDSFVDYSKHNVRERFNEVISFMKNHNFYEKKQLDEFQDSYNVLLGSALDEWAIRKKKSWIDNKTTIAFVGEFSSGKTSIVNRILSQDNPNIPQLPVSAKATTAIPTYISGGKSQAQYRFFTPDNILKSLSKEQFEKLDHETLKEIGSVKSLITYLVLSYENKNLETLSILDTPGFSNNEEDSSRTADVINECDALFWAIDVNNGTINRNSLEIIKQKLKKPLYVVLNKIDTKSPSEVDKVEDLVRKTFREAKVDVKEFIRFSGKKEKCSLDTIMKPIMSIPKVKDEVAADMAVLTEVKEILDWISEAHRTNQLEYRSAEKKIEQTVKQFDSEVENIQQDCINASNLMEVHETWLGFGDNVFKMSMNKGERLLGILEELCDTRAPHLSDLTNSYGEAMSNYTFYLQVIEELKSLKKGFSECEEHIRKEISKINK